MVLRVGLKIVIAMVFVLVCGNISVLYATSPNEPDTIKHIKFHFRASSASLEQEYMSNGKSLGALDAILLRSSFIEKTDSLIVLAGASPDGDWENNNRLAQNRAKAIKSYIAERCQALHRDKIKTYLTVSQWAELIPLVKADCAYPYQTAILAILSEQGTPAATEHRLRKLAKGDAWPYISTNYLSQFRSGDASIIFFIEGKAVTLDEAVKIDPSTTVSLPKIDSTLLIQSAPVSAFTEKTQEQVSVPSLQQAAIEEPPVWRPLLAVKTNLLFDAASLLNVEVEVPIGKRWSIAGEWIFPWWLWERQQVCLQVLSGNLEGRYWFGNRNDHPKLTGWFAGFYIGAGLYDLEWKTKGYQGEFFIAAGLSGGYAHTINKSGTMRMEYSLGIGYMQTEYREYIPINGGEILSWQRDGRYSWFGPTRAKVSLVWMINHKSKKGGVK